jgi:hypothetical protein
MKKFLFLAFAMILVGAVSAQSYSPKAVVKKTTLKEVLSMAKNVPFSEKFDDTVATVTTWTKTVTFAAKTWMFGNPASGSFSTIDPTNTYSIIIPYNLPTDPLQNEWFISPSVTAQAGLQNLFVSFYAGYSKEYLPSGGGGNPGATLKCLISKNNGTTWTTVWDANTDANTPAGWSWKKRNIQVDSLIGQSFKIAFQYTGKDGDLAAVDNVMVGEILPNKMKIAAINMPNFVSNASPISVKAVLKNVGGNVITSATVKYQIDNNAVVTGALTGANIASDAEYTYTHPTTWSPATAQAYTVKIWAESVNGVSGANSDTLSKQVVAISQSPAKKVIVEEATGAWCGYCPDGAVKLQALMGSNHNVIGVAIHNGDAMAFTDGNTVNDAYISGFPSGLVDRFKFDGEEAVELDRGQWAAKATERQQMPTPVKITGTNTYDAGSRLLTVNLTARFYASISGDYRFNCYVVEDSCSGTGTTWNQSNYYNTTAGHPMNGLGNPIIGYQHRHVLRNMLGGSWGTATSIPATIVANTDYTKTFTFTLPAGYNPARILVVGLVQKYSANESDREILNADEMFLNGGTGIAENSAIAQLNVYPNPASGSSTMSIVLKQASELSVSVMNIVGETVRTQNFGTVEAGSFNTTLDLSNLTKGVYMVKINAGNQTSFQKVMVY